MYTLPAPVHQPTCPVCGHVVRIVDRLVWGEWQPYLDACDHYSPVTASNWT